MLPLTVAKRPGVGESGVAKGGEFDRATRNIKHGVFVLHRPAEAEATFVKGCYNGRHEKLYFHDHAPHVMRNDFDNGGLLGLKKSNVHAPIY